MITHLKPVNQAQNELADKLIELADIIRTTNPDGVFRAVLVLDGRGCINTISAGASMTVSETVGLLEYAKLMAVMEGCKP